ncbi:MAG TPA: hypothetical protein PLN21_10175 [Gemmatales bacterium]|nr:hypothetical protein [Gemmatales bacterium]
MSRLFSYAATVVLSLAVSSLNAAVGVTPYGKQIRELHQIKSILECADHDYKGHRAAAVKEITKAIHALEAHGGHYQKSATHPQHSNANGKPHEPQALSDAQLRAAIQGLAVVSQQLQATGSRHPRTSKAAADIQLAIKQLNVALTIK